jgi:hypothetical protein
MNHNISQEPRNFLNTWATICFQGEALLHEIRLPQPEGPGPHIYIPQE